MILSSGVEEREAAEKLGFRQLEVSHRRRIGFAGEDCGREKSRGPESEDEAIKDLDRKSVV